MSIKNDVKLRSVVRNSMPNVSGPSLDELALLALRSAPALARSWGSTYADVDKVSPSLAGPKLSDMANYPVVYSQPRQALISPTLKSDIDNIVANSLDIRFPSSTGIVDANGILASGGEVVSMSANPTSLDEAALLARNQIGSPDDPVVQALLNATASEKAANDRAIDTSNDLDREVQDEPAVSARQTDTELGRPTELAANSRPQLSTECQGIGREIANSRDRKEKILRELSGVNGRIRAKSGELAELAPELAEEMGEAIRDLLIVGGKKSKLERALDIAQIIKGAISQFAGPTRKKIEKLTKDIESLSAQADKLHGDLRSVEAELKKAWADAGHHNCKFEHYHTNNY